MRLLGFWSVSRRHDLYCNNILSTAAQKSEAPPPGCRDSGEKLFGPWKPQNTPAVPHRGFEDLVLGVGCLVENIKGNERRIGSQMFILPERSN